MSAHPLDRADLRGRTEKALAAFLADRRTEMTGIDQDLLPLADAVEAFVLGGGKRLRPAFAYWGYRGAGGEDRDEVVAAVASLELVQASALMHDDLMDASDTRRGKPSMHRRFETLHSARRWRGDRSGFGAAAAILLGDLCLVWSDELLHSSGLDATTLARARPDFDRMRTEVTVGQYLDLLTQANGVTSAARATQVARLKSAKYTVERPLLLGASLAGAAPRLRRAYSAFGLPLGEAFQLRDDVLGVFGDPAVTGKPAGDDLREGKRTYLIAAAFENLDGAGRAELEAGLGRTDLDDDAVDRLREIIIVSGARERTEAHIEHLSNTALMALDDADVAPHARTVLRDLAEAAVRRAA